MKCKSCKREIDDDSFFCKWCGREVARGRKKKEEVSVPKPRQFKSGEWFAQVMVDGERYPVKAATEAEYYIKARALKQGLIEGQKKKSGTTLRKVIRSYIDSTDSVLSPATIRGYEIIYRNRFDAYMDKDIQSINWQQMVSEEAKTVSPKTAVNAWGLVAAALKAKNIDVPKVHTPKVPKSDEGWLNFEEIGIFLKHLEGDSVECAALLALHGLRTSEFLDLDVSQISEKGIVIRGASVPDKDNNLVHKDTNKTEASRRTVPVMIPRLLEVLPEGGKAVTLSAMSIRRGLERVCSKAQLPVVTPHDLRRSFTSLAFHLGWNAQTTMQVGGWSNMQTVNEVYRKLADADRKADVVKMQNYYQDYYENQKP